MNNIQIEKNDKYVFRIVKGLIISFLVSLISIFIFALTLSYTSLSEGVIPITIIILTFVSVLIGSVITTRKASRNGMINGGIIGACYVIFIYILSSILNTGFQLNLYSILMIIAGIIAGLIGGIIGINS